MPDTDRADPASSDTGDHRSRITFRPLNDDLPVLHGWLNDPAVVQWWEGDDPVTTGSR